VHGVALEFIVLWEPIEKSEFTLEHILGRVEIANLEE